MNGKGSRQRPGKPGAYARGYEAINWAKNRPGRVPRKETIDGVEWVIPSLSEILGPRAVCSTCNQRAPGDGLCPYAEEINGVERECDCCDECRHQCAMDI